MKGWGPRLATGVPKSLALMLLVAWSAACDADSYSLNGVDVELDVRLDSIVVVATQALDSVDAGNLVAASLSGARAVRRLSERSWVLRIDRASRRQVRAGIRETMDSPSVRWAGFMVRTEGTVEAAFVTNEFVAQFQPGLTRIEIDALNQSHGVEIIQELGLLDSQFLLRVTSRSNDDALRMAKEYARDARTLYAHPNFVIETLELSAPWPYDDAYVAGNQWHLYDAPLGDASDARSDIMAPEAWTVTVGDPSITIAVIERKGFDVTHQDLVNKLWQNPWEAGTGSGTEPFTAKSGDLNGWNFEGCPSADSSSSETPYTILTDPCGSDDLDSGSQAHGTQVAGVAAAETNNGVGGAGVCPGCSLMLIRMGATVTSVTRASAIAYANHMGADVINLSITLSYNDPTTIAAVNSAVSNGRAGFGLTIAVATQNSVSQLGGNRPLLVCNGSTLNVEDFVIAVIPSKRNVVNDEKYSRQAGFCVDIMAPGAAIWTTAPGDAYTSVQGSSFATAVVSGVVGLLLSKNPELTPSQIYDAITQTAVKVEGPPGWTPPAAWTPPAGWTPDYDPPVTGRSDLFGFGRINAYEALNAVPGGPGFPDATVVIMLNPPPATVTTTTAALTFTIQGEASDPDGFSWLGIVVREDVLGDGCDVTDPLVPKGSGPGQMLQPNPIDKTGSMSSAENVTIYNTNTQDGSDQILCFFVEGVDLPPFSNLETAVTRTVVDWR